MDEFLKKLGSFFGLTILLAGNFFAWSLVVLKLYTWFLLPIFTQLPEITYWQAMGLWVFLALFKNLNVNRVKDKFLKEKSEMYITAIVAPWVILLIGVIVK